MRVLPIILFVLILFPLGSVSAQLGQLTTGIASEGVTIVLDPQFPNPGDQVTASIDDYSISNTGAVINWFFDGLNAPNVTNNRTITFTAPPIGDSMNIIARLTFPDKKILEGRRVLTPLYLDVIIEPQTYTPAFYQGRALPTKGSLVNVNALLQTKNGPVDPADYSYNWSLNNKSIYGGSKVGTSWGQFTIPHGLSSTLTISVQDKTGATVARKLVAIPSVPLEVQFYELNTLLGQSTRAITNSIIITANSTSIRAVPYYLDNRAVNGNLFTQWTINNRVTPTENSDPFEINLEKGSAGTAMINFKVRNLTELLQSDEARFQVKL